MEKIEGDGRKTLRHFMKRKLIHPPDKPLRVRIVSKPQTDDVEHIGAEDSSESEAEILDDFSNGIGAMSSTYISRRQRGADLSTSECDSVEEVIDVNSKLLSQMSYLFHGLFNETNVGSQEEPLTIQIEASEEHAFVALLEFIYFSSMPPPSYQEIVDLLMTADEFQVKWVDVREFLAAEAMNYVTQTGDDILSIKNELLQQPFSRIKAFFCMDYLKVESEDVVYDFIVCWAQTHYPKPEAHRTAKQLHLERLIRFSYLTRQKLEDALQCDFFYPESVSEAVVEALAFKIEEPYRRRLPQGWWSSNKFFERRYKRTPIQVNRLWFPEFDRCEVCLSLPTSELDYMFHSLGRSESEDFQLGRQLLCLVASCKEVTRTFCFDLSITAKAENWDENIYATRFMVHNGAGWLEIGTGTFIPAKQENVGGHDLIPGFWTQLITRTCPYMLADTLHLCVEITCRR